MTLFHTIFYFFSLLDETDIFALNDVFSVLMNISCLIIIIISKTKLLLGHYTFSEF